MGRHFVEDKKNGFFCRAYVSHDMVLLTWNMRDPEGFQGVVLERDGHSMNISSPTSKIQRFSWGDYSVESGADYSYRINFYRGDMVVSTLTLQIAVPNAKSLPHAVYFNRGVAGSQKYAHCFASQVEGVDPEARRKWLGKNLVDAMLEFVDQATDKGMYLYVAAYELTFVPFLESLKSAIARGVHVKVIYDCKSSKGVLITSSAEAEQALQATQFPKANLIPRTKPASAISHNKFIVFCGIDHRPVALFTGSTNFTESGVYGQLNAAHWIKDPGLASKYLKCWEILSKDPAANECRTLFEQLSPLPHQLSRHDMIPVFSPRPNANLLKLQCRLASSATESVFLTAAFGVNPLLQAELTKSSSSTERFLLLESTARLGQEFLNAAPLKHRISVGALINDPETAEILGLKVEELSGLNKHVQFVHTKLFAIDLFSNCPVVVFGSGNFSEASCTKNDENQIICRGDVELADQIICHFFRVFDHFEWRYGLQKNKPTRNFLKEPKPDNWAANWFVPGSEKERRRNLLCSMVEDHLKPAASDFIMLDVNTYDVPQPVPSRTIVRQADGHFVVSFPYRADLVEKFKQVIPAALRQYNVQTKIWRVQDAAVSELDRLVDEDGFVKM